MSENLEIIWKDITSDISKTVSENWWTLLLQKYNENDRDSHNLIYLEEKFNEFENFRNCIQNLKSFTLALFFQYFEYSPKNVECQEKNLESFAKFATEAGIPKDSDLYKEVITLLEASAVHSTDEHKTEGAYGKDDLHYFLDLDMCVLGSSESKYAHYINNIHSEYSFLDPVTYINLRKKVLQSFLLIPNIFATKEFREKYEAQARKNIRDELNNLKKL